MTKAKDEPGIDLSGEGGDDGGGGDEKPKRGRPAKAVKTRDLKARISETIGELAEWAEKLGDDELAGILRDDGPKMAAWLAYHAEKRQRLATGLSRVFGEGSAFDFGRAFGRLLRALQGRIGEALPRPRIGEPEEEGEPEAEPGAFGAGAG